MSAKMLRYCEFLLRRHDANGDGKLDSTEWQSLGDDLAAADLDGDGLLTAQELAQYATKFGSGRQIRLAARPAGSVLPDAIDPTADAEQAPAAEHADLPRRRSLQYFAPVPDGTPAWFLERDLDGDAQLTLAEFSPRLRAAEVAEFKRYDLNGDGILTPAELSRALSRLKESAPQTPNAR